MKPFRKGLIVLSVIAVFSLIAIGCVQAGPKEDKFVAEALEIIKKNYIYPADLESCRYQILAHLKSRKSPEALRQEGDPSLEGDSACFDKYSHLLTPEEFKAMQEEVSGHFSGIGAAIEPGKNGGVEVVEPFEGSPALKAGIRAGDKIVKVRQENEAEAKYVGDSADEAKKMLRGSKGTKVFVTVERAGNLLDFEITRDDIKTQTVKYKDLPNGIGYISLSMFGGESADDLEMALRSFRKYGPNPKVIIDIRENPGGCLGCVLEMLYYFSDKPDDIMLTTKFKRREKVDTIKNTFGGFIDPTTKQLKSPGEFKDYRIVILVNQRSASASEIFSGTMKDWGFMVVGSTTYGKGVGQTIFSLFDGSGFALTTFEYLVGNSKTSVNKKGVSPNVQAVDTRTSLEDTLGRKDSQFQKALEVLNKM